MHDKSDYLKILMFIPSMSGGGAERVFATLANEFASMNIDVVLVVLNKNGPNMALLSDDVRVVELGVTRIRESFIPLVRLLKKEMPSILISALNFPNIIALAAAKLARRNIKTIMTVHYNPATYGDYAQLFEKLSTLVMPMFYNSSDRVVAISESVVKGLVKQGVRTNKIVRIFNPIKLPPTDISKSFDKCNYGFDNSSLPLLIAIGRLQEVKNYELILNAMSILKGKYPCNLIILGEGPDEKILQRKILNDGLSHCVKLLGYQDNTYDYLMSANLLLLASNSEGFSNVVVEAMAVGLNVVSADCGGPNEILANGEYGFLFPVGDIDSFVSCIENALVHPLQKRVLQKRAKTFDSKSIANEYIKLINSV